MNANVRHSTNPMAHALLAPLPLPFPRHHCPPPAFQDDQGVFTDFQKYKDVFPNLFSRKSILNLVFFPKTTFFGEKNESHHPRILAITINVHTIQLIEQLIFLCGIFDAWVSVRLVIAKWHYGQSWSKNSQALSYSFRFFKHSGCISRFVGSLLKQVASWSMLRDTSPESSGVRCPDSSPGQA